MRALALAAAVATSLATPGLAEAKSLDGQTVHLYTYGGNYLEVIKKFVIEPFEAETGAKVVIDDSCCTRLSAAMGAGEYIGDLILGQDQSNLLNLQKLGWLVADPRLLESAKAAGAAESLQSDSMLLTYIYAYIMAGSDPSAPMPQTWAEFWDTEKFPGTRGMISGEPAPQLEAALLADGVPADQLYPLDVDRAFAKLDALRAATDVLFAESGAQQINLLATGEATYSLVYSNRVVLAANDGIALGYSYGEALQVPNGGAILKGAKNIDGAVALLQYHYRPEVLARVAEATGLAPAYESAVAMIAEEKRPLMPTDPANTRTAVLVDLPYWRDNRDSIYERWVAWLAQ